MTSALLALCLLLPHQDAGIALEHDQLAPDLGLTSWLQPHAEEGRSFERNVNRSGRPGEQASKQDGEDRSRVAAYHGVPLVVHTLAWNDSKCTGELLPLMRDLVLANVDRGIAMIGVAQSDGEEDPQGDLDRYKSHDLPYPVAREDLFASESPYVDVAGHGLAYAHVIGPNGALLWSGNPLEDQDDFLGSVQAAYNRIVVPRLERPLHANLRKATANYLEGRLRKALDQAVKALPSKDDAQRADAGLMIDLIAEAEKGWLREAHTLAAGMGRLRFLEVARALREALPRSDAVDEIEDMEKELRKELAWSIRSKELEEWLDLREARPPLFPVRSSRDGDRFAAKLEQYLRKTSNSHEGTQAAEDLLDRYIPND